MLIVVIIFTLIVALFILPSLIGEQKKSLSSVQDSLDQRMTQLKQEFQFRTKELARRLKSGDLAQEEWEELSKELELDTVASIEATESATRADKSSQSIVVGSLLVIVIGALGTISYYTSNDIEKNESQNKVVEAIKSDANYISSLRVTANEKKDEKSLKALYLALRVAVDIQPNEVENWRELSVFSTRVGMTKDAIEAANMALEIEPDNDSIRVELAQAMATSKDENDVRRANLILQRIVTKNPGHQGALITLGFNSFNLGNYPLAIKSWEALLSTRDPGSEGAKMIERSIQVAKFRLAEMNTPTASQKSASNNSGADNASSENGIKVSLQIDEELMASLKGNESLFIFAKAVEGPPLPLAVVRTTVDKAAETFVLSDANAMRPEFKLSNYEKVQIVARVSIAGVATAAPGDLEGKSDIVEGPFENKAIELKINTKL